MKLKLTLRQLESLLQRQKEKVIDRLSSDSYLYNTESTSGSLKTLPIDKDKMKQIGMDAQFPEDFLTLKKYIEEDDR